MFHQLNKIQIYTKRILYKTTHIQFWHNFPSRCKYAHPRDVPFVPPHTFSIYFTTIFPVKILVSELASITFSLRPEEALLVLTLQKPVWIHFHYFNSVLLCRLIVSLINRIGNLYSISLDLFTDTTVPTRNSKFSSLKIIIEQESSFHLHTYIQSKVSFQESQLYIQAETKNRAKTNTGMRLNVNLGRKMTQSVFPPDIGMKIAA